MKRPMRRTIDPTTNEKNDQQIEATNEKNYRPTNMMKRPMRQNYRPTNMMKRPTEEL